MKVSVIVPTLNEADNIVTTLAPLQPWRQQGHEVVIADGGSQDETKALAHPLADQLIHAPRGRANQMNAGASASRGELLLFLHADTRLPAGALPAMLRAMETASWGRFDVRLSGSHPLLRMIEFMMNLRSRITAIATGDQAIFIHRALFERIGGFPELALMEDIAMSRELKRHGRPCCIRERVITSSRRWENNGILKTVWLMWNLRLAYFLGADPRRLAHRYRNE